MLLDDCISELPSRRQNNLIRILVYGRHLNCSCWCGIQKWSCSLSHVSKANFTNFHLFPQNRHEEKSIYEQVCGDISRDLFRKLCSSSWQEPYSFLNVDRTLPECTGKYGRCFMEKYRLIPNRDENNLWRRTAAPKDEKERRTAQEKCRGRLPWKSNCSREADRNARNDAGLSRYVQGGSLPNSF